MKISDLQMPKGSSIIFNGRASKKDNEEVEIRFSRTTLEKISTKHNIQLFDVTFGPRWGVRYFSDPYATRKKSFKPDESGSIYPQVLKEVGDFLSEVEEALKKDKGYKPETYNF